MLLQQSGMLSVGGHLLVLPHKNGVALGGIVHPGIDVHFDLAFLTDQCGKVLYWSDFKLFGNVES